MRTVPRLRLQLLGGFRAEREGAGEPVAGWQRRSAKVLTKLLAATPGHALHREQVLDTLWPGADLESALNSFGKALHAARRALEPQLLPREGSSYLRLTDSVVALDPERVWVDADHFELLAESALRHSDVPAYEAALAAYGGELLPEDRYEDWCAERRDCLDELHLRLLTGLADCLSERGAHAPAAARLREALQHDPTREDVHRRLMAVYVAAGTRDKAVRQFHVCREVLARDLGLTPSDETREVYEEIVAGTPEEALPSPFVGREPTLLQLGEQLTKAEGRHGRVVLIHGEAGVGKSRLVAEFAAQAKGRGARVLCGGNGAHSNQLAYGPFAVALEGYAASCPASERADIARRYPALASFIPSLGVGKQAASAVDDRLYLVPSIVRLLTEIAERQALVLFLGDLHGLHRSTLDLLGYLAPLAAERRWLIVGTYRDEAAPCGSALQRWVEATEHEGLSIGLELERLPRADCDRLVRTLHGRADRALLDHVYTRSLGNPLFVEALAREPARRVPADVRAHVASQLAPMKESVRRVLALVAAGNGTKLSLPDLSSAAAALRPPISDVAMFEALDRALELQVLEERDGFYAFRHPLVRSALFESLSKHRRDELQDALRRSR